MFSDRHRRASWFAALNHIASLIGVIMLVMTALGLLPSAWSVSFVPIWVLVVGFLNMDRIVHFIIIHPSEQTNHGG
jgi:uncharacterized membrane-anchored protein